MTPSQEKPGPDKEKLLGDLISLLERHPEVLQDLKGRLDAGDSGKPTEPTATPVVPVPKNASSPAGNAFPALQKPLGPAAPLQVPPVRPMKAVPAPAVDSHATRKTAMQLHSPPDARPVAAPNSPNTSPPLNPPVSTPLPIGRAKQGIWQRIGGRSLVIAALIHVLLLIIGVFWVLQVIYPPQKKVDFLPAGGGGGERGAKDVSVKKMKQITPTTNVKRVFAEGAKASYAIPEQGDDFGNMSALSSLSGGGMSGGLGGSGLGSGFGKGNGSGAGSALGGAGSGKLFGPLNLFGQKGALEGIQGTFRDFKIDRKKEPTGIDTSMPGYVDILQDFKKRGWNSQRWKHYESPTKINAKFFFFPAIEDRLAGPAFDSKDSQAGLWVAHYQGTFKATVPGRYRFIGWGDNVLAVKIGNKVVLDACDVQRETGAFLDEREVVGSVAFPNKSGGTAIFAGEWMSFGTSKESIEVLLGDHGGIFCAGLFIQPEGTNLTFGPTGIPNVPLFLLGALTDGERTLLEGVPPESLNGPIFEASGKKTDF